MTRLRRLIATALIDSFGLSLGWTVFSLQVVHDHGLAGLGLCNAAMLAGVALSAPVAASNVVAWTGYAGMRAEVAAADPRGAAMTWYMVAVAAIEAAGTATAALLPMGPGNRVAGGLLAAVIACYGGCLLPTWLVAAGPGSPAPSLSAALNLSAAPSLSAALSLSAAPPRAGPTRSCAESPGGGA